MNFLFHLMLSLPHRSAMDESFIKRTMNNINLYDYGFYYGTYLMESE